MHHAPRCPQAPWRSSEGDDTIWSVQRPCPCGCPDGYDPGVCSTRARRGLTRLGHLLGQPVPSARSRARRAVQFGDVGPGAAAEITSLRHALNSMLVSCERRFINHWLRRHIPLFTGHRPRPTYVGRSTDGGARTAVRCACPPSMSNERVVLVCTVRWPESRIGDAECAPVTPHYE